MTQYKEFQGKSLDEAIQEACAYFGVPREKLEIDILNDAKGGIFGLMGMKKASIRAARVQIAESLDSLLETPNAPRKDARGSGEGGGAENAAAEAGRKDDKGREAKKAAPKPRQAREQKREPGNAAQPAAQPREPRSSEQRSADERVPEERAPEQRADERAPEQRPAEQRQEAKDPRRKPPRTRDAASSEKQPGKASPEKRASDKPAPGKRPAQKRQEAHTAAPHAPAPDALAPDLPDDDSGRESLPEFDLEKGDLQLLGQCVSETVLRLVRPIVGDVPCEVVVNGRRVRAILDCGDASGLLVGRDGQTLASVQYLASRIIARRLGASVRLQIDAGRYRERQDDKLRELALSLADKARQSGRAQSTRPLTAYQRRIIHLALESDPQVHTRSKGEGPQRRVLILLKRDQDAAVADEARDWNGGPDNAQETGETEQP